MDIPVLDGRAYLDRMTALQRPDAKVLAFYEHRVGAVCTDPAALLIPADDHLVHRGDGVFESLKFVGRKLYQVDAHLERMRRSCATAHLSPPCPWEDFEAIIKAVALAGGRDNGLIRILIGRGPGGFGIDPAECPRSSLYVVAHVFSPKPEAVFEKGMTAFKTSIPAKQDWIASIKSTNYLPNVLMRREAAEKGYDLPICFDRHGFVAEGAIDNVAIVDQKDVLVIPESRNALAGTTMARLLDLVAGEVKVRFTGVTEGDIYEAKEMMSFGTTTDCIAIVRFNGKPIHDVRPGPMAKRFRQLLMADLEANGKPF